MPAFDCFQVAACSYFGYSHVEVAHCYFHAAYSLHFLPALDLNVVQVEENYVVVRCSDDCFPAHYFSAAPPDGSEMPDYYRCFFAAPDYFSQVPHAGRSVVVQDAPDEMPALELFLHAGVMLLPLLQLGVVPESHLPGAQCSHYSGLLLGGKWKLNYPKPW